MKINKVKILVNTFFVLDALFWLTDKSNFLLTVSYNFGLLLFNDLFIRFYAGGTNDQEGKGWIFLFFAIAFILAFITMIIYSFATERLKFIPAIIIVNRIGVTKIENGAAICPMMLLTVTSVIPSPIAKIFLSLMSIYFVGCDQSFLATNSLIPANNIAYPPKPYSPQLYTRYLFRL